MSIVYTNKNKLHMYLLSLICIERTNLHINYRF